MPRYEVLIRRKVYQWVTLDIEAKSPLAAKRLALRTAKGAWLPDPPIPGVAVEEKDGWGWDEPFGKRKIVALSSDDGDHTDD
jgi:hypothetical protein